MRRVKKVLVAGVIVVGCLVSFFLIYRLNPVTLFEKSDTSTITTDWLDAKLAEWQPTKVSPVTFSMFFSSISYGNVVQGWNTPAVLAADRDMLLQTGCQGLTIDLNYDPWLQNNQTLIDTDDSLIASIRANGTLVVLKDAAAESYRNHKISWAQFQDAWVARVTFLAERYKPNYYTVIKEPGWYFAMIADFPINPDIFNENTWTNLAARLIAAVKSVSPSTKVGVSVPADIYHEKTGLHLRFMTQVITLPDLDFIGFDIYGPTGFDDTLLFLSQVGSNGKAVWINEAWTTTKAAESADSSQQALDAEWAKVVYYFALKIGAQGLSPFFTDYLASYQPRPTDEAQLLSFYAGRTPVFYAFQDIIQANKNLAPI
ncbi:MAG TPA: hypothetical protein VKK79_25765 [Candidatus Lokiarchaeia archaeon]|nr:hypothetical protein [Candidatus Lokiarchaeia archaeon]